MSWRVDVSGVVGGGAVGRDTHFSEVEDIHFSEVEDIHFSEVEDIHFSEVEDIHFSEVEDIHFSEVEDIHFSEVEDILGLRDVVFPLQWMSIVNEVFNWAVVVS